MRLIANLEKGSATAQESATSVLAIPNHFLAWRSPHLVSPPGAGDGLVPGSCYEGKKNWGRGRPLPQAAARTTLSYDKSHEESSVRVGDTWPDRIGAGDGLVPAFCGRQRNGGDEPSDEPSPALG